MKNLYGDTFVSIPVLIKEAERAVEANAQFSALCLTLALVGNCSQVEWLKTNSTVVGHDRDAYIAWYDMWEKDIKNDIELNRETTCGKLPHLDGSFLYQIRCMLFHTTSADIDFKNCNKITDDANQKITNFKFVLNESNPFLMGVGTYSSDSNGEKSVDIDIQCLVRKLLYLIQLYYDENKDLFKHKGFSVYNHTDDYFSMMNNE